MAKNNSPNTRKDTSSKARKAKKIKTTKRKSSVPKPRNNGTMTESMFWQSIRACLRQKSRYWKPITAVRNEARRASKSANRRLKYEYICSVCGNWFPAKHIEVHHSEPVGTLSCAADLPGFVERLFCEKEGLCVICNKCHKQHHEQKAA